MKVTLGYRVKDSSGQHVHTTQAGHAKACKGIGCLCSCGFLAAGSCGFYTDGDHKSLLLSKSDALRLLACWLECGYVGKVVKVTGKL